MLESKGFFSILLRLQEQNGRMCFGESSKFARTAEVLLLPK
jgi:hypothetical protein